MAPEAASGDARTRSGAPARRRRGSEKKSAPAPRAPRLTVDDWIDAAFALLVSEGVSEVKITTLCERLKVTKGSFYWHFADIDELMTAIADKWCDEQNDTLRGLAQVDTVPVDARLQVMAELLLQERTWAVEAAVRDWARTYDKIAVVVRELDQRIFDVVQNSMRELGFDEAEARLRAGFLVYAGIGFVHARDNLPTPTPDEVRAMFALLTAR
ncbi:TetR/AcrR family transcriptional regulator [Rhodococcus sp. BP-349]|uniref:TetR/AcrR family transcriptional regulator n=1 Tax=unclassified Rhodococcus (in: high G+C Gram-positive bacteria) TaxID=192944 RepID=UPI00047FB8E1|nr:MULTISPECIES: TetR/AcrR family transcriptional regulator [unclassified Rhodococcus (in: high G+C Gram-positive bacteria)]KIQ17524.1 TetR family transcriptional regulator [Rhodococcus sp. MEB064]KQU07000.1 TetR family transcriptional regulator [Rhodococcus sp. Leaf7]KQU38500.1 TetR family transcriptional regulator [Rhodococcus sp. Leaf225]KQU39863.1 TetR family transcriptional regulator [Rhodococcus sp. Leaf258]KQU42518.1 TetR family transcriptional regulator [Rhodococcus sp. Leaf247]